MSRVGAERRRGWSPPKRELRRREVLLCSLDVPDARGELSEDTAGSIPILHSINPAEPAAAKP